MSTTAKSRPANAAFKLYPPWWRDRYLEEAQTVTSDLIQAGRSRWRIALNLSNGALRARLTARGIPMEAGPWASRTRASIVLATAPALLVVPLMLTMRQVSGLRDGSGGITSSSHLTTTLYVVLGLAFVALISAVIWGYRSLLHGVTTRRDNGRALRVLARMPALLAALAVGLWVTSLLIEPHRFVGHGRGVIPLDGYPLAAHVLLVAAGVAWCVCWIVSVVLLQAVAHRTELSVASLGLGKVFSVTVSILIWLMTAAALGLSAVTSKQISQLSGFRVQSVVFGHSLWLLGILLCVLSVASTVGAVLTSRSWKVLAHLAT